MMRLLFFIMGILFLGCGIVFRIMHWPYAIVLLISSSVLFLLSFVFYYWKKEKPEPNSILDQEILDDV